MASLKLILSFCCLTWALQVAISQQCQPFAFISPSTVVQFGDQVQLDCSYDGAASVGVSWTKDPQQSIDASSRPCHCAVTFYNSGTESSLFINVTDGGDLGSYTCTAVFGFGDTCTASVQVLKAVPPVLTAVGSSSQTASQGSTVTFSVSLTTPGLPLASVVWTKDGVPLYNTTNSTTSTLQLSNIQPVDRGQYVAMATNMAGSNSVTFMLLESFYPVVNMSVTTSGSQAMLVCEAYGYPTLTDVTILGGTSISNIFPRDNFTSWGRASSIQPLMGCPMTFQCKATNGFGATTIQTMACSVGVDMFVVKPVGTNAVFLQWVSTSGSVANFTVMYQPITTPPMVTLATVACQTCNYTVSGLTQRWVYSFAIGYGSQVSQPLTAAVGAGLSTVTMVTATTVSAVSNVIAVTWNPTPYASGYLVHANYGVGGAFNVNITTGTSANISVSCKTPYLVQVQAYNITGFSSLSPAVVAYAYCSSNPTISSVTVDNSVVKVTFDNTVPGTTMKLTAFQDDGSGYSWSVTVDASGGACLSGIPEGAGYSLCAYFAQGDWHCYPNKTSVGKGDPLQPCGMTFGLPSRSSSADAAPGSPLDPLAVGIVIVGTFGGVAAVFCFFGLFIACRKEKSSSYDISPSSSVYTPTKHSPTQDLSPHYSCIDPSANYGMAASVSNLQTYNVTCKEVVPPQAYNMSCKEMVPPQAYNMSCKEVVPPQAYNMTFERSWGESYENVKNCKHDESCATAV